MELRTNELVLNKFVPEDAFAVSKLAGDKTVSEMTANIPHPYSLEVARNWINDHSRQQMEDDNFIFAVRLIDTLELIGCINLGLNRSHNSGHIGYWIGAPYWGQGYCTEALRAMISFGFSKFDLNRVWAQCKSSNIASVKVMEKSGMKKEGVLRESIRKDCEYFDIIVCSILSSEYMVKGL